MSITFVNLNTTITIYHITPQHREKWWTEIRSCRRRRQIAIDGTVPLLTVFNTSNEFEFMEFKVREWVVGRDENVKNGLKYRIWIILYCIYFIVVGTPSKQDFVWTFLTHKSTYLYVVYIHTHIRNKNTI